MAMTLEVDALAQEIRRVDGNHSLGAGVLAEALMLFIAPHLTQPAQAVDVAKVREVIAEMGAVDEAAGPTIDDWAEKLTAALPTSPTPDKDQR